MAINNLRSLVTRTERHDAHHVTIRVETDDPDARNVLVFEHTECVGNTDEILAARQKADDVVKAFILNRWAEERP